MEDLPTDAEPAPATHNREQPVVWERWQKKRTFVRALEGTYSHLTKELLDQPRVISSRSVPWKGGPNLYGKHVIAPGAAAKITQLVGVEAVRHQARRSRGRQLQRKRFRTWLTPCRASAQPSAAS